MAGLTPPSHAEITSSGQVWLDEDGIIIAVGSSHQLHTLEHAVENTNVNARLVGNVRRPFLIDMNKVKSMSREAREYYAGPEPKKVITAVAILTNSSVGKAVANFFLLLTKPSVPTRMFTDFDEAKSWLMQYKESVSDELLTEKAVV
jgi:hypothetical protein